MKNFIIRTGIGIGATLVVGCTSITSGGGPTAASDTSTTSTRTPRHTDNSGRPDVTFDPCLDLQDETLSSAGYDPRSETQADFTPDSYTFLGCSYNTSPRLYGLNVLSGNISFAEEQEKVKAFARTTEVNGRQALIKSEANKPNACAISIETPYGVLILDRSVFKGHGDDAPESEWCAGLEDTARVFEPFIPKGD
ncbi:DUF3558 domain-containing protein [Rhodococcus oxybenzonivorans]|uniref:DUF3558 domain-containing protein n=1 Tax=Rhodococcus oxybenzonivorans TaxID=1990687 RepID=UPI00295382BB|nr:DUF3558 domain-containing protein [Rhodococcus oxybenzonivorans]MDV7352932.1 DUF3558 domain-containing protein [Rhodococcus oxybenzonivorans]